jgi:hypothetical protein
MTEPNPSHHPAAASHAELRAQATELRLHGLLAHWDELMGQPETEQRVRQWLGWESAERAHRSLERRLREAHLGRFKPLADFDWSWPKECDRAAIEELMSLQFLADASSVVLFGPNGVGKTMVAANLGHQAVLQGHTALFTTAGQMLSELAALDSDSALRRRLQHYAAPDLLLIDLCAEFSDVQWAAVGRLPSTARRSNGLPQTAHYCHSRRSHPVMSSPLKTKAPPLGGARISGNTWASAWRFRSRSARAYRMVVFRLAWPSH